MHKAIILLLCTCSHLTELPAFHLHKEHTLNIIKQLQIHIKVGQFIYLFVFTNSTWRFRWTRTVQEFTSNPVNCSGQKNGGKVLKNVQACCLDIFKTRHLVLALLQRLTLTFFKQNFLPLGSEVSSCFKNGAKLNVCVRARAKVK